jgi:hypothetical protein
MVGDDVSKPFVDWLQKSLLKPGSTVWEKSCVREKGVFEGGSSLVALGKPKETVRTSRFERD